MSIEEDHPPSHTFRSDMQELAIGEQCPIGTGVRFSRLAELPQCLDTSLSEEPKTKIYFFQRLGERPLKTYLRVNSREDEVGLYYPEPPPHGNPCEETYKKAMQERLVDASHVASLIREILHSEVALTVRPVEREQSDNTSTTLYLLTTEANKK